MLTRENFGFGDIFMWKPAFPSLNCVVVCRFSVNQNDGLTVRSSREGWQCPGCLLGLCSVYQGFMSTRLKNTDEAHQGDFS